MYENECWNNSPICELNPEFYDLPLIYEIMCDVKSKTIIVLCF